MKVQVRHYPDSVRREIGCYYENDKLRSFVNKHIDEYTLVAEMDLEGDSQEILDKVWELTNSVEFNWFDNPDAGCVVQGGVRSSCKGDVFVIDNKSYIVSSFGFTTL